MRLHPLLARQDVVLVSRTAVSDPPTEADFSVAARTILEAAGIRPSGERVVIKPNLTASVVRATPFDGVTTHPAFIRGLVDGLHERGARRDRLYLVEDPLDQDHDGPRDWAVTGVPQALEGTGTKLRFPTLRTVTRRKVSQPLVHGERRVSRLAVEPGTVLLNVPKLKTHTWAITTLCLKNLMGLDYVTDRHYCAQSIRVATPRMNEETGIPVDQWLTTADHERIQRGLAERLVDLAKVVRPTLNIVEGVVGREGTGFQRGSNRTLGLCLAGTNPVTVDAFASWLMGFDPEKLIFLQCASEAGLGTIDPRAIEVYTVEVGGPVRCRDAAGLRIDPPFHVITECVDANPERYR